MMVGVNFSTMDITVVFARMDIQETTASLVCIHYPISSVNSLLKFPYIYYPYKCFQFPPLHFWHISFLSKEFYFIVCLEIYCEDMLLNMNLFLIKLHL